MRINDALPPEYQLQFAVLRDPSIKFVSGTIVVSMETAAEISATCSDDALACAESNINRLLNYTVSSHLYIPDNIESYEHMETVIVHELLHALGLWGHVDSTEFPDSIMGAAGEYIPDFGYILSRIDREVLQIMCMSQDTETYNDWGEWSDTSHHLVGRTADGDLNFGVALFNGLPQPWARGIQPGTDLADSSLSGTATWNGAMPRSRFD